MGAVFGEGEDIGVVEGLMMGEIAFGGAPAFVVETAAENIFGDRVDGKACPGHPAEAVDV